MRWMIVAAVTSIAAAPAIGIAAQTSTRVSGQFNNSQENACIHVSKFFYLTDCMYTWSHFKIGGNPLPWTGPTVNPVYFARESPHAVPTYIPVAGDDRIAPTMEGTLTIDDRGTTRPGGRHGERRRSWSVRRPDRRRQRQRARRRSRGTPPRAVISWSSITHTLAPTAVTTAEPDGKGGMVYVIASKGFPERLCRKADPYRLLPERPRRRRPPTGRTITSGMIPRRSASRAIPPSTATSARARRP